MIYVGGQLPKIYIFIDLWFILDMGLLQIPVEISGFQHNLTALVCQFIRVVNLRVDAFRRQFIQFQLLRTFLPRLIWENNRLLFRLSCLIHDLVLDWRSFLKNYSLNVRDRRTPKVSIPVTPHNWKLNRWRNSCGLNCWVLLHHWDCDLLNRHRWGQNLGGVVVVWNYFLFQSWKIVVIWLMAR